MIYFNNDIWKLLSTEKIDHGKLFKKIVYIYYKYYIALIFFLIIIEFSLVSKQSYTETFFFDIWQFN